MGFDLSLVESEERYHGAFVCAICQNLVDLDSLVTTACSHCFCKSCLPTWLERSYKCPTCNQDLLYANNNDKTAIRSMMIGDRAVLVQSLQVAQPLAHRMLRSLLVRCPLHESVQCHWKGDYGDVEAHLLSGSAHDVAAKSPSKSSLNDKQNTDAESASNLSSANNPKRFLATSLKAQANAKFESRHYKEALSLYTKAIEVLETTIPSSSSDPPSLLDTEAQSLLATLYSNRAATNLQTQDFSACLQDCQTILREHWDTSNNTKVYVRASRAYVQMGDLSQAKGYLTEGLKHQPNNGALKKELQKIESMLEWEETGRNYLQLEQFAAAKKTYGSLLKEAAAADPFLLGAAQADLGLGLTDSALRLTKRVLVKHAQNPRGCWIRGQAVFLMGDAKLGIQLMQEALRLDPDSKDLKATYRQAKQVREWMEATQQAMFTRKFDQAIELLTQCLETYRPSTLPPKSKLYADLYTQRAEAHLRLKHFHEALKDCALVVYAQEDCIPAWLIRCQANHGIGKHEDALEHARDLLQKWPQDPRLRQAYERADFLLRKERRVDFYKLLGVPSIASGMEIRKAYKRKALELHPDKAPPDQQKVAQRRFQQLGQALEILTDNHQRKLWDEGYDPDAIRERIEAANQAAHRGGGHHGHSHY